MSADLGADLTAIPTIGVQTAAAVTSENDTALA